MVVVVVSSEQSGIFHGDFIRTKFLGIILFPLGFLRTPFLCVNAVYPRAPRETLSEIRSAQSPTYLYVECVLHPHTRKSGSCLHVQFLGNSEVR